MKRARPLAGRATPALVAVLVIAVATVVVVFATAGSPTSRDGEGREPTTPAASPPTAVSSRGADANALSADVSADDATGSASSTGQPTTDLAPSPDPSPAAAATAPPGTAAVTDDAMAEPVPPPPAAAVAPTVAEPVTIAAHEAQPEAKQVGVDVAHALTNYEADATVEEIAAAVTDDVTRHAPLVEAAAPVHHPGQWSRGTVEYAQMGGLRPDRTSIMVVVRQEIGAGGEIERVETRTMDVRLVRTDGTWTFDELADAGGRPVERPVELSAEAAAVVDDPRITLPDSAVWDIYRGHTSPTLLRLMAELADRTPFAAVVLASGHPHNVFATDRVSNHTIGRAVDIYRLGDTRIIDDRGPDSVALDTVRWIYARPDVSEVGSPWALDGAGGRSFTDEVHQDHIHIGVW